MELIRPNTNFDFVGRAKIAMAVSLVVILLGIGSLIFKGGPSYGIDFAGGTLVQIRFTADTSAADLRSALDSLDLRGLSIQQFGDHANEYLVRVQESDENLSTLASQIQSTLEKKYGAGKLEIRRTEMVGPQVGKDLREKGVQAIIFSIIGMLIYVTFRFEFRFGIGAVIALVHDVLVTLTAFTLLNLEIDLTIIAAFLTIVGYSVNDTVVICDRIRENMGKYHDLPLAQVINRSLNETLSRTILTSGLTLLSVISLLIFGGSVLQNFAFALLVGMIAGVYSTVFIASPVLILWDNYRTSRKAASA
ncbi:MAG: protein translocase subunit SecF [Deltaproteobacteria bacterium]|nr:MAG: protein translocase subunit SecF [Deltaproteobacteria bacterium]